MLNPQKPSVFTTQLIFDIKNWIPPLWAVPSVMELPELAGGGSQATPLSALGKRGPVKKCIQLHTCGQHLNTHKTEQSNNF